MPLHEKVPGQKTFVYIKPEGGAFSYEDPETKEKKTCSVIEGTLDLVKIEADPGNPKNKIQPYDAFIMHISDDSAVYRLKINVDRNFTFSVASVLGDLQKGDTISAKAKPGNDPMITFCNIVKRNEDGSTWVRPTVAELPKDRTEKIEVVKTIIESHPANPNNK